MRSNVFLYGFVLVGFMVFAGISRADMVWDPDSGWLAEDEDSSSEQVVTEETEQGNSQPPEAPQPQSAEQPPRSGGEPSTDSAARPAAARPASAAASSSAYVPIREREEFALFERPLRRPEQLAQGFEYIEAGKLDKAERFFNSFAKKNPDSSVCQDAVYWTGKCQFDRRRYEQCYTTMEKLLSKIPRTDVNANALILEYKVADRFLSGARKKLFGLALLGQEEEAVQWLRTIIEREPYGRLAEMAQWRIASHRHNRRDYPQAYIEYDFFLECYPRSDRALEAEYLKFDCKYHQALKARYDEGSLAEVRDGLRFFLEKDPPSELAERARTLLDDARNRLAQKSIEVADYYIRKRHPNSAIVYLKAVIAEYPGTEGEAKAKDMLAKLLKTQPAPETGAK